MSPIRAHAASARLVAPSAPVFDEAGFVLRALRMAGREVRHASLVNDVLIALTARRLGATLYTGDAEDFRAIRGVRDFSLEVVETRKPRQPARGRKALRPASISDAARIPGGATRP